MEKLENLLESKPDVLIVHAGTNDLPKNINPLNYLRNIHWKYLELSPGTKLVFSVIIIRRDKTIYTINENTDSVTKSLEELSIALLSWFK